MCIRDSHQRFPLVPERRVPRHRAKPRDGVRGVVAVSYTHLDVYKRQGLLGGGEQDYWKLFVPIVVGMIAGSWVSGRLAHLPGRRLAFVGYLVGTIGLLINLGLALIPATRGLPYSVLAIPLLAFGMSVVFPILTLAMLDLFPTDRGAAASVQGFASLLVNAVIAGVVAPLLGGSLVTLAVGSLVLFTTAWLIWTRHVRRTRLAPTTPDAPGYEPLDEM